MSTKSNRSERTEEQMFEESLRAHGQLADEDSDELSPGVTHHIEKNERGERTVRRDRFSAI